jgi:hypothetical protein
MKRKELYEYIRQEIINELTLAEGGTVNIIATSGNEEEQSVQNDPKIKQKPDVIKALKNATPGQVIRASTNENEADRGSTYRIGNAAKVALAKELYGPETIEGRLIAAIEGSENGLTQKKLGEKLNLKASGLTYFLQKLAFAQVLVKPAKVATTEPEPIVNQDDDADVEVQDDYEKPEEEESVPEEPKSKEEIEKDKLAQILSSSSDNEIKIFNNYLKSVNKNKKNKVYVDAILKLAKEKAKLPLILMNQLYKASGRGEIKNPK